MWLATWNFSIDLPLWYSIENIFKMKRGLRVYLVLLQADCSLRSDDLHFSQSLRWRLRKLSINFIWRWIGWLCSSHRDKRGNKRCSQSSQIVPNGCLTASLLPLKHHHIVRPRCSHLWEPRGNMRRNGTRSGKLHARCALVSSYVYLSCWTLNHRTI